MPMPRKKIPPDLRSLARGHTELCIKVLAGMVSQEAVSPAARVAAANILLDRGWGKPPQAHTVENGDEEIQVIFRHLVDGSDLEYQTALQIDAVPVPGRSDDTDEEQ